MLRYIYVILFFLLKCTPYLQGQCNPGEMPDTILYTCEGEFAEALAFNSEVFSGCILAYTLHDFGGGFLSNPLDINLTGSFEMGEAYFDEIYYICAVAGPDEDNDGLPDFDHPDTQISYGTEVQFLKENLFELDFQCSENDGSINIALNLIDGVNPLRAPFVLSHNLGADTLNVGGPAITLPSNTHSFDLQLIEQPEDYCYFIENIEQLQQPCFFDLALRLTERDNKAESYAPEDTVRLKVEVFNQGTLPVKSAELVAYLPDGFTIVYNDLNDNNWIDLDNNNQATYFLQEMLLPDSSKNIVLELLLSQNLEEEIYKPTVEIASFQSLNDTFLDDIDSYPDRDEQNDTIVDDEIIDALIDEDDHDISELQVILNAVNKYPEFEENISINTIGPLPVNTLLNIQYKTKEYQTIDIALYNINGQKLEAKAQKTTNDINTVQFNMVDLDNGIYFVRLSNQQQIVSKRIIKQ